MNNLPPTQNIVLNLDVHRVPLSVVREQEVFYRDAAKMLNERFRHYRQRFPSVQAEKLWVYVALDMAVNLQSDAFDKSLQPVTDKLNELNEKVKQALGEESSNHN